jgi:hypothetical protein
VSLALHRILPDRPENQQHNNCQDQKTLKSLSWLLQKEINRGYLILDWKNLGVGKERKTILLF